LPQSLKTELKISDIRGSELWFGVIEAVGEKKREKKSRLGNEVDQGRSLLFLYSFFTFSEELPF